MTEPTTQESDLMNMIERDWKAANTASTTEAYADLCGFIRGCIIGLAGSGSHASFVAHADDLWFIWGVAYQLRFSSRNPNWG